MGEWRDGAWNWSWIWRRELWDRECVMLNDLISVISLHIPKQDEADKWRCQPGTNGKYSTKVVYEHLHRLKSDPNEEGKEEFTLILNKIALPKVRVRAWRVLWEQRPTTTKLQRRRCLPPNTNNKLHF